MEGHFNGTSKDHQHLLSQLMDYVMCEIKGVWTYVDDVLVDMREYENHHKHLETVLWRIRKYGLKLNMGKNHRSRGGAVPWKYAQHGQS